MKILDPPPCIASGNQYVAVVADRRSKLMQALPARKESFALVANVFFDSWLMMHGMLTYLLTDVRE